MPKPELQIFPNSDLAKLHKAVSLMRAITHPLRMKMLGFIDRHKAIHVNKIYTSMNLEQSITSQHLKIMRSAHLVNMRREGKYILYSVNYKLIENIHTILEEYKVK